MSFTIYIKKLLAYIIQKVVSIFAKIKCSDIQYQVSKKSTSKSSDKIDINSIMLSKVMPLKQNNQSNKIHENNTDQKYEKIFDLWEIQYDKCPVDDLLPDPKIALFQDNTKQQMNQEYDVFPLVKIETSIDAFAYDINDDQIAKNVQWICSETEHSFNDQESVDCTCLQYQSNQWYNEKDQPIELHVNYQDIFPPIECNCYSNPKKKKGPY